MNLARQLRPELILMELETTDLPEEERAEIAPEKYLLRQKGLILEEIVEALDRSGRVARPRRLLEDLTNREKKAPTGLKCGIALPHVRTPQVKEFLFSVARSTPGLEYGCLDGGPAHLFITLVAPPWDSDIYLKIYRKLAEAISVYGDDLTREFLEARNEGEIIRAVRRLED
jgi:mannitol/fructose-specific phosphotransferase system IIA component (Ntr-type)